MMIETIISFGEQLVDGTSSHFNFIVILWFGKKETFVTSVAELT